jgi:hypothetical protein
MVHMLHVVSCEKGETSSASLPSLASLVISIAPVLVISFGAGLLVGAAQAVQSQQTFIVMAP